MPETVIDQQARTDATKAQHGVDLVAQKLDTHLASCGERYADNAKRHDSLATDVKDGFAAQSKTASRLHERFDKQMFWLVRGLGAVILACVGIIATILWVA